jgi:hypothetical protein
VRSERSGATGWPVNFFHGQCQPSPWPDWGWHVDGNWFRHTVDNSRQGLLLVGLFSDIVPGGGGTVVAAGSHRRTARVLAAHPDGLPHRVLFERVLAEPIGNFHEIVGAAGDVVLAHPFLFHTRGYERHGEPRSSATPRRRCGRRCSSSAATGTTRCWSDRSGRRWRSGPRRRRRTRCAANSDARSSRLKRVSVSG